MTTILHLALLIGLLLITAFHKLPAQNISFSIPTFNTSIVNLSMNASITSQGILSLTLDRIDTSLTRSIGRAMFKDRVQMCDSASKTAASFSTTFVFAINSTTEGYAADGLTFVITEKDAAPENSAGGYFTLVNRTNDGNSSNRFVAVEFDTYNNPGWDLVVPADHVGNHVGIDVNGVKSVELRDLDYAYMNLSSGKDISAWIEYDGKAELMQVYVAYYHEGKEKPSDSPVLNHSVDLCGLLAEYAYVGFTASTGQGMELHRVKSWNFSTSGLPSEIGLAPRAGPSSSPVQRQSPPSKKNGSKTTEILGVTAGILLALILIATIFIGCKLKYKGRQRNQSSSHASDKRLQIDLSCIGAFGPHKFNHRELSVATENFSPKHLLGKGGFGSVYKAVLKDGSVVAVKCVSKDSKQGEREFTAEVITIGRLRHRNLVRLLGWCHHGAELLLVYEYLPNGSLDKLLFEEKQVILSWDQRHKIVCGLASALCYLHYDWEQQVIHRDVKASNVMLDSEFDARLGDFGLARLIKRNTNPETTIVAGTLGYMAPEYIQTRKATAKSDVFSFGVVVLEVACARRSIAMDAAADDDVVDWVWNLHREGRLLEAADPAMEGNFDEDGMTRLLIVGLACSHPDPTMRPNMRQVLQILLEEAPAPSIPNAKPVAFYGSPLTSKSCTSSTISSTMSSQISVPSSVGSRISTTKPLLLEEEEGTW